MKPNLPQVSHITEIEDENTRVRTLTLDLHLQAEPGQFIMAWLPGLDEKPFSLVQSDPVTLTVARVGPFSSAVHRLEIGEPLWIRGPLGSAFRLPEDKPSSGALMLVGGGYGVAPLHFLAQRAVDAGWAASMIIGARTKSDVIFADRFRALGAKVAITTDDGTLGQQGVATDAAQQLLDQSTYRALYACGPEPMLKAIEELAQSRKLSAQLSYERHIRCGFGICGSCARGGWRVCKDGPVRQVKPEENPLSQGFWMPLQENPSQS